MTQQEQELLKGLTDRVNSTSLTNKDQDAEQTLRTALGGNPDALYILCQTVLVQQFAMDNAQRQLTEARAELDRLRQAAKPQEHGSFLGSLFGLGKSDDAPNSMVHSAQSSQGTQGYQPVNAPGAPPAGYAPVQPGYGGGSLQGAGGYTSGAAQPYGNQAGAGMFGGGGGFLQGAMQTAAGVVAGQFAFRALEDVFHGFGGGEGRGFTGGTEVVNNYYGDDAQGSSDSFGDRLRDADGMNGSMSSDIEDRRGESRGFLGGADNDGGFNAADDASGADGNDFNDSSSDDSGSDFSGGGDDGNNY